MNERLSSRYPGVALVTGASAGLGKAFAQHLAGEGMDLVLVARRGDLLQELASELQEKHPVKVHVFEQDLARKRAAEKLKAFTDEQGLCISLLVNNAGFGSLGRFDELDPAKEIEMVNLNCRAPVALSSVYLPDMVQRKNGAIVMLASSAAYQATPYMAVYGATKAFNLHFAEALWAELKPLGIDVIALSPGFTRTEFHAVAGIKETPPDIFVAEPEDVIATCFSKLGRAPSVVHGYFNFMTSCGTRLAPRALNAKLAGAIMKPRK